MARKKISSLQSKTQFLILLCLSKDRNSSIGIYRETNISQSNAHEQLQRLLSENLVMKHRKYDYEINYPALTKLFYEYSFKHKGAKFNKKIPELSEIEKYKIIENNMKDILDNLTIEMGSIGKITLEEFFSHLKKYIIEKGKKSYSEHSKQPLNYVKIVARQINIAPEDIKISESMFSKEKEVNLLEKLSFFLLFSSPKMDFLEFITYKLLNKN